MNILIVDDEAAIRDGIEKRILKYGYTPEHIYKASYAGQAMEILERNPVDLVFADINMPFMNGLEFIEKYKDSGMAFVIVSGYDNFSYAQKAIELGVVRYLLKPINRQEFQKVMDEMTERFRRKEDRMEYGASTGQILTCMRCHVDDVTFSLGACAQLLGISESTVSKALKKDVGMGFSDLLNQYRIELAVQLLGQSEGRIRMVQLAERCGFTSQQYFSVVFRKIMQMTPSQYKEKLLKQPAEEN